MRNCIILGSGRSGTSMLAGSLRAAGYYMGANLYAGNPGNPKGFFEDPEINGINEDLLAQITPFKPGGVLGRLFRSRVGGGQRWLASIPVGTPIPYPPAIARRIARETAKAPFCFKDPRFSYTLPAWRPFLRNAVFLCVFREPSRTAHSILKECQDAPYLRTFSIDFHGAIQVWTLMYRHILEVHRHSGQWFFAHYDQVLDGSAIPRLESLLGVQVDRQLADPALKRSQPEGEVGPDVHGVYEQLCELAGYECRSSLPG